MTSRSPTLEGFRILFRRPMIPAAEIAWRWSFGGALWFLSGMLFVEYADSLTVDARDRLLLQSGQPILVQRALRHVFAGSGIGFAESLAIVFLGLVILWMLAASLGRLGTLKALGEEFKVAEESCLRRSGPLRSLLGLNFLRAAGALSAVVGALGVVLAASSIWARSSALLADTARLWFAVTCLIWLAWVIVNWFLSTASLFVVTRRRPAFAALRSLAELCHDQLGAVIIVGIWFGLAHVASFIVACAFGFGALGLVGSLGPAALVVVESFIAVAYFAVADFLYAGRLAAYLVLIGERGIVDAAGTDLVGGPSAGRIDQSELIFSDVPA